MIDEKLKKSGRAGRWTGRRRGGGQACMLVYVGRYVGRCRKILEKII
jgi:hypothetical protein